MATQLDGIDAERRPASPEGTTPAGHGVAHALREVKGHIELLGVEGGARLETPDDIIDAPGDDSAVSSDVYARRCGQRVNQVFEESLVPDVAWQFQLRKVKVLLRPVSAAILEVAVPSAPRLAVVSQGGPEALTIRVCPGVPP